MTAPMPRLPEERLAELHALAAAALTGSPTAEQVARLDELVCEDPAFRKLYVRYMFTSLNLRAWARYPLSDAVGAQLGSPPPDADLALLQRLNDPDQELADGDERSFCDIRHSPFLAPPRSIPLPPVIIQTLPSPHVSLPSFFGGMLFSYLIAAVVLGAALALASVWKLSDRAQVVDDRLPAVPLRTVPAPDPSVVGRITAMADCAWEGTGATDQKSEVINHKSLLRLGDRLALRSGLLEITYDCGAQVILQGPVTFEVESSAGGYLSVGKLTAKLETKSLPSPSGRGAGGEGVARNLPSPACGGHHGVVGAGGEGNRNSPPSTLHSPLFAIRTPTALVTDLGTEFGVEVDKNGRTVSHVFRGSVELRTVPSGNTGSSAARVLHENQSAVVESVETHRGCRIDVLSSPTTTPFVRSIPKLRIASIDLADISAGGTGCSRRGGSGIAPATGRVVNAYPQEFVVDDGQYRRVPGLPFVDGVFVPNGRNGAVQTNSSGHRFGGFAETSGMTAGCVWAIRDSLRLSPPIARDHLPQKASEEFSYRYEMDYLPNDVQHVDRDGNARQDLEQGASAAAVTGGILTLTDSCFSAKKPASIWPERFSFARGFTIEARVKIESSSGKEPFALWATLPTHHGDAGMCLTVGDKDLAWEGTRHVQRFACQTSDEYHVYRVVQKPGQKEFSLWRDAVLVSSRLPSDADNGGHAEMGFGKYGQKWQGVSLIDYVRITPGAFAPLPPIESPADVAVHRHFRSLAATLAQTGRHGVESDGLLLHANAGITFDLQAIRQATGGGRIRQLLATAEMIESPEDRAEPLANIWILVDGQPRFRLREINCHHGKHPVSVPLAADDRFLTLVVTDNGGGMEHGCVLFGRPRLEMIVPSDYDAPDGR